MPTLVWIITIVVNTQLLVQTTLHLCTVLTILCTTFSFVKQQHLNWAASLFACDKLLHQLLLSHHNRWNCLGSIFRMVSWFSWLCSNVSFWRYIHTQPVSNHDHYCHYQERHYIHYCQCDFRRKTIYLVAPQSIWMKKNSSDIPSSKCIGTASKVKFTLQLKALHTTCMRGIKGNFEETEQVAIESNQ